MSVLSIDELNLIYKGNYKRRSIPYNRYFGNMDLTDEQKKYRIDFSEKMEEIILFIFYLIEIYTENLYTDRESVVQSLIDRYKLLVLNYIDIDSYIENYIEEISNEIVEETDSEYAIPYILSIDRAMFIAENEANTILNYIEYREAVKNGYKEKMWITENDRKVRKTHKRVNGKRIDINEPFEVGNSKLMFPKDNSLGASAEEIVNCRCTARYFK